MGNDRALGQLLVAAVVFGIVELLADFLCVRCTGTLDYSVARSMEILESPCGCRCLGRWSPPSGALDGGVAVPWAHWRVPC